MVNESICELSGAMTRLAKVVASLVRERDRLAGRPRVGALRVALKVKP